MNQLKESVPTSGVIHDFVTSRDGTRISYRTSGNGPGLIVIPGALTMAADFEAFSAELANDFTVYTIDRRGRGQSGPQGSDYSITKECEDIQALQEKTSARYLFGHSFGGFIALEVARNNQNLDKIAVYEPGVSIDQSVPVGWAELCREQLTHNKYSDAFITFIRGVNPEMAGKTPKWLFKLIIPLALNKDERLHKYKLLAGTIREHKEAARLDNTYQHYREISARVLLMLGGREKGTSIERAGLKLAEVLPEAKLVRFPKFDHFGPEKKPGEVAAELRLYFFS